MFPLSPAREGGVQPQKNTVLKGKQSQTPLGAQAFLELRAGCPEREHRLQAWGGGRPGRMAENWFEFPFSSAVCSQVPAETCLDSLLSVQFSCSVVSNSLRPHGLQHTRPPCPSPTPGVYSNSRPLSR